MMVDAYAPCPCGSGKKFKWCCQAFYQQIERAFAANANGQFELALQLLDELTVQHPHSAEVWGRRAELLWENDRKDDAEQSLDRALESNPQYAFGHYLRGMFRHEEGEIPGALLLYRKAADLCAGAATDLLGEIYASIGQCEVLLHRPLAARAAWTISLRHKPQDELRQHLEGLTGAESELPAIARQEFRFKKPGATAGRDQQAAWDRAFGGAASGRLADAAQAFEHLTAADPAQAAAWYNLGLVRAWRGDNRGALDAWDSYVTNEPDENEAAAAWALTEVLRLGEGMSEASDYVEHVATYRIRDIAAVAQTLSRSKRLVDVQQAQGVIGGTWLDREMPPGENLASFQLPHVAAHLVIVRDDLQLINMDAEMLDKARLSIEALLGSAIDPPQLETRPPRFNLLLVPAVSISIPAGVDEDRAHRMIEEHLRQYFEEQWAHRPLRSLGQTKPIDAAGHPTLRKKLLGVIQFVQDCRLRGLPLPYDFDRLRHKLGLPTQKPVDVMTADIHAMNAPELRALDATKLSAEDLEKAFQTAVRLDADDLAARFAQALIERPPQADRPDRFPLYNHLNQNADDATAAMGWVEAGLKYDCEHNDGRRRNDYELIRARLHIEHDEPEIAHDVYARLIQRAPSDLNLLGKAAEAMLSAGLALYAAAFAEQGLARARQKADREHAGYFEELLAAAKRKL